MQYAITVESLGKWFKRYHAKRSRTFMEAALSGLKYSRSIDRFWALQDVNFRVLPGETFGILGQNGAGKSTLLQLLAGVGRPDVGHIAIQGKIGALLDIGANFHTELTGRDNVLMSGLVAGLSKQQIQRRFDEIVEFAEIAHFIDDPVRTYSSGMKMRLAFSCAIHTDPEILLVDEFLAVGDMQFQRKCLNRIQQLKEDGCAIVLISQNPDQIQAMCDHALWLQQGNVAAYGEAEIVGAQYRDFIFSQVEEGLNINKIPEISVTDYPVRITGVSLFPSAKINSGDPLCVEIGYWNPKPITDPIFSIRVCNHRGEICFSRNTKPFDLVLPDVQGKGKIKLMIRRLDLNAGEYCVNVGIHSQDWSSTYDYHANLYPFQVSSELEFKGVLNPPYEWVLLDEESQDLARFN
jgi:lipopolysaccharide transport system ATP-binding protein